MHDLIVRVLKEDASEEEIRQLTVWRRASPENERAYVQIKRVWDVTGDNRIPWTTAPPPVAHIVAEAESRRSRRIVTAWRGRRVARWRLAPAGLAAAAAALVVIVIGRSARGADWVYATGLTEHETVALEDGSVVRLGPASVLRGRGSARAVQLDGRAFFAVAADPDHPFTVRTPVGRTVVLGTRFEIATGGDSLRLLVVEGRVGLSASGRSVEVGRGQVSRVIGRSVPSEPVSANIWELLEWPGGALMFQATPFVEVLEQISRHFGISFTIADPNLERRSVTAWFEDESLEEIVRTVCGVVGADCRVDDAIRVLP